MKYRNIYAKCMYLFFVAVLFIGVNIKAELCVDYSTQSLLSLLNALQFTMNKGFQEIEDSAGAGADDVVDSLCDVIWESTESIIESIQMNTADIVGEVEYRTESVVDELQDLRNVIDGLDQLVIERNFSKSGNFATSYGTITSGGYYTLKATTTGCITIAADDVTLDLGEFTLYCQTGPVIMVNSGFKNIEIKNGALKSDGSQEGVLVDNSCEQIAIRNIRAYNCSSGIFFDGSSGQIKHCIVNNCDFYDCNIGINASDLSTSVCANCSAVRSADFSISLFECSYNIFQNCKMLCGGGFKTKTGTVNLFSECISIEASAQGFFLDGETYTKVVHCVISNSQSAGIQVSDIVSAGCVLEDNEVLNAGNYGILFNIGADPDNNLLLKNISYNNTLGNYSSTPNPVFNVYNYASCCPGATRPNRYDNLDITGC